MENNTRLRSIKIDIDKLITLADLGLGAERPLNKEKRYWIKKLVKQASNEFKPILVSPIKKTGYYILCDGWHRVQAAKKKKEKKMLALQVPIKAGLGLAKANKILRDIDKEHKYKLGTSGIIAHWALLRFKENDGSN